MRRASSSLGVDQEDGSATPPAAVGVVCQEHARGGWISHPPATSDSGYTEAPAVELLRATREEVIRSFEALPAPRGPDEPSQHDRGIEGGLLSPPPCRFLPERPALVAIPHTSLSLSLPKCVVVQDGHVSQAHRAQDFGHSSCADWSEIGLSTLPQAAAAESGPRVEATPLDLILRSLTQLPR